MTRECRTCKKPFLARRKNEVCCSSACSAVYYRVTHRRESTAKELTCDVCGALFKRKSWKQRACSRQCSQALKSAADTARYVATRKERPDVSDAELERRLEAYFARVAVVRDCMVSRTPLAGREI